MLSIRCAKQHRLITTVSMYDCIIIGCGPAGIQAAVYTARADLSTLVLGDPTQGHLYTSHIIANYFGFPEDISGPELIDRGIRQAQRFGAAFRENNVVDVTRDGDGFRVQIDSNEILETKSVILATGMMYIASGIPREKEFVGKGLSYCVTCDGVFFRDKKVFVIGSGSFAAEEALALRTYTPNITIITQRKPWKVSSEFEGELAHYQIQKRDTKIASVATGENGMIGNVTFDDGTAEPVEGIFVAVGTAGPQSFAKKLGLEMEGQYIRADRAGRTNLEHVYAVGNCTGANAQVATSVGAGCDAAIDIIRRMRGQRVYVDYN